MYYTDKRRNGTGNQVFSPKIIEVRILGGFWVSRNTSGQNEESNWRVTGETRAHGIGSKGPSRMITEHHYIFVIKRNRSERGNGKIQI